MTPNRDDTQPVMSEANAPIPAVQSGAVAWAFLQPMPGRRPEPKWMTTTSPDEVEALRENGIEVRELVFAAPQSEPLPGGVGELDDIQVHHIVRRACEAAGSIAAWARANNLSDEQVRLFLRGKRPPEPKLLKVLGLVRRVTYQEDGSGQKIAALSGKEQG